MYSPMVDMGKLTNIDNERPNNHHHHQPEQTNKTSSTSYYGDIGNGCESIIRELNAIQASSNALMFEHNRLIAEKDYLEKRLNEKYCFLSMELSKQQEIANRLENIISTVAPFLPSEKQIELSNSIYHAKQFSGDDMKMLADQQIGCNDLMVLPEQGEIVNNDQTSLANLMLQFFLLNATDQNCTFSQPSLNVSKSSEKQVTIIEPTKSVIKPNTNVKPPAPKRKRTVVKRPPSKPANKTTIQSGKKSPEQSRLSEFGIKLYKQNSLLAPKPLPTQLDVKPFYKVEGQENSQVSTSTSAPKILKQTSMLDHFTSQKMLDHIRDK